MQRNGVDICLVEDDDSQRAVLRRHLLRLDYSLIEAADGEDALTQVRRHRPRVVICDANIPGIDGIEVCRRIRSDPTLDGTYVIVITAYDSRERKHRALHAGSDDYLPKPFDIEELEARIRNGMRVSRLQERLRHAALTDSLTGLWNHSQFRQILDREFLRTRRYGGVVSLLMIDLDHFKAVNDTFGHEIGNRVLKATARHLAHMVRDIDTVARYGGEEFAIVCPQTGLDEAAQIAERIRISLPQQVQLPDVPQLSVTASIGVVSSRHASVTNVADLINLADQALYSAKRQGRNAVVRAGEGTAAPGENGVQVHELELLRKQVVALSMQAKVLCLQSVWALVQALEARDPHTALHSQNVTYYVTELAKAAGWPEGLCHITANAAMLHDLGIIGVPDQILQKRDPLTPEEAAVVRRVPLMTCKILEPLRIFEAETLVIRHLRERYDGTGYPDGLIGTHIPLGARLLAVAEAFDAMTSTRAYRQGRTVDEAVTAIQGGAGTQFDPEFAALLGRTISDQRAQWETRVAAALERQSVETPPRPVSSPSG